MLTPQQRPPRLGLQEPSRRTTRHRTSVSTSSLLPSWKRPWRSVLQTTSAYSPSSKQNNRLTADASAPPQTSMAQPYTLCRTIRDSPQGRSCQLMEDGTSQKDSLTE